MTRPLIEDLPPIGTTNHLIIINGKHPCIALNKEFIPNTVILNTKLDHNRNEEEDDENDETYKRVQLITGPNMGGKSTVLRTTSILVIIA